MKEMDKPRICVYGAGNDNIDACHKKNAYLLGKELGRKNHPLIFGGGSYGVMGSVARGAHSSGGKIYAIAPTWIKDFEGVFSYCEKFIFTKNMIERKALFDKYSDVFIIAPGGIGTLDELFEILALKKLNQSEKPVIIFNSENFYDSLLKLLEDLIEKNVIESTDINLYDIAYSVEEIFEILEGYGLSL